MITHKEFKKLLMEEVSDIAQMLIEKNTSYGNSALDPVRIFSKTDAIEQLYVRIDDKLSRLQKGKQTTINEDTVKDLIGYLLILRIQQKYNQSFDK